MSHPVPSDDRSQRSAAASGSSSPPPKVDRRVSGDGAVHSLILSDPPGNVVDIAMCRQLDARLREAAADRRSKLVVLRGAGRHFSYGASVREHLPERAAEMLGSLHTVVRALASFPQTTLAAVQGRCLGGGLELALACDFVFVEEGAVLAAPEIRLGVFAPAATALLEGRVGRGAAADLLLAARQIGATEAVELGLAQRRAEAGELDELVEGFADDSLRPRSAASLRLAVTALRGGWRARLGERLDELERLYLDELLDLHDGTEGIRAFLDKRPPRWQDG